MKRKATQKSEHDAARGMLNTIELNTHEDDRASSWHLHLLSCFVEALAFEGICLKMLVLRGRALWALIMR